MQIEQFTDKIVELGKSCGLSNLQIQQAMEKIQPSTNSKFQEFLNTVAENLHKFETDKDRELFMNFIAIDLANFIREIR
ncbi:MAG: hypothetical protein IJM31_01340 [Campylobacter sp.]|nr:hypothetical protein [Campylobacter sp.]MBQ9875716.1 hypothetical protein [Campylobacter sp.]